MPAIPSFINSYNPGRKAKAVFKSSLSRFNRPDASSDVHPRPSSAPSTIIDIKDDQSSLDFDGGQPDEYENDILDNRRPSNVSSLLPPAKLEITLPPDSLGIDWFADNFEEQLPPDAELDTATLNLLDQDTRDTLAGKIKDDQGLVETLEDALARHVDSNPSRLVVISGLHLKLPEMSPSSSSNLSPGPLTIPNDQLDSALRKLPRDSLTMLTSRLSVSDTPSSSALSGTTLARALISNTFAMPVDRLSGVGLTRSDSTVLPRDSSYHFKFSIASDAPPMPPDAESLYVAPKRPRAERRKQLKRRSSTGSLRPKALPDLPGRRTSLNLDSTASDSDGRFRSLPPWSPDSIPEPSPDLSIPESTPPVTPPTDTARSDNNSFTLPPLPEGVRRLPDPRSQPSTSPMSSKSTPKELDTKGLDDVLDYYNLSDPPPLLVGATFRPLVSPIKEETSSQLSSMGSHFRNDRRDSRRLPPVGARSPRLRSDSMQSTRRPSDTRSPSKLLRFPSSNASSYSGSLKSSRSFEPDSVSTHGQDTRSPSRQRTLSNSLPTSSPALDTSSSGGDFPRVNVAEDYIPPVIYTSPIEINLSTSPVYMETHAQDPSVGQSVHATPSTDSPTMLPNLVVLNGSTGSNVDGTTDQSDYPQDQHHHHTYKVDFMSRGSTISMMGSPPPYSEVVNQISMQAGRSIYAAQSISDSIPGPSRFSGEWNVNESRRESPARVRVRPRPPLPIGPRRPSQGGQSLPSGIALSHSRDRSGSLASISQPGHTRERSGHPLTAIPSPRFQIPPPKWRGHTMDAARWTFKSSQLQAIVSKAIKQSSEASLIRLLEPEVLENDLPGEIASLETARTDIKTRYKLLARRRAAVFEALSSSFLNGTTTTTDEGSNTNANNNNNHRLLEELSEISATMDHLSEELHSADTQLAQLDSLVQLHTSSALAVALRKLNRSFLKQMAENETLRNEIFSVEVERDEAWRQAELIAIELDQLASSSSGGQSPIVSNRSSKTSAHRKSSSITKGGGSKVPKARFSKRLSLRPGAFVSGFSVSSPSPALSAKGAGHLLRHSRTVSPALRSGRQIPLVLNESELLGPHVLPLPSLSSASSATRALIQAQDELYAMLGLTMPQSSNVLLRRSQSWSLNVAGGGVSSSSSSSPSSPLVSPSSLVTPSRRYSVLTNNNHHHQHPHHNNNNHLRPLDGTRATNRRSSLPPDSTLAQVSNAMAADRNAMLVTFDMLSATDPSS